MCQDWDFRFACSSKAALEDANRLVPYSPRPVRVPRPPACKTHGIRVIDVLCEAERLKPGRDPSVEVAQVGTHHGEPAATRHGWVEFQAAAVMLEPVVEQRRR